MAKLLGEDLERYCEMQYDQILKLQLQVKELRQENLALKATLKSTASLLPKESKQDSDEEAIARGEIAKLRELSRVQVLTTDEAKRLDTYVKILLSKKQKDQENELTKAMSDAELLSKLE